MPLPQGVPRRTRSTQRRPPGAGRDFQVRGGALVFPRALVKEGRLGFWKWFWGAWGIGTYGKNDQVDVSWEVDGRPRVAHALEIERGSGGS